MEQEGEGRTTAGWRNSVQLPSIPNQVIGPTRDHRVSVPADGLPVARARLLALVSIAAMNGSSISTAELQPLLPSRIFEDPESVERFVATDQHLREMLQVRSGEVFPRGAHELAVRRGAQRRLAEERVRLAESFVPRLERLCPGLELLAISGSTAFGGAEPEDDVDIFLVTSRGRMWVELLMAMAIAKLDRMGRPGTPTFCFNRVTELEPCRSVFARPGDALFAREALSLKVLHGDERFRELLRSAAWMEDHFPNLYHGAVHADPRGISLHAESGSAVWSLANVVGFLVLAPYLWLAGIVRNRRLRRQGNAGALFRTVVRYRFFSYESNKFEALRAQYLGAF